MRKALSIIVSLLLFVANFIITGSIVTTNDVVTTTNVTTTTIESVNVTYMTFDGHVATGYIDADVFVNDKFNEYDGININTTVYADATLTNECGYIYTFGWLWDCTTTSATTTSVSTNVVNIATTNTAIVITTSCIQAIVSDVNVVVITVDDEEEDIATTPTAVAIATVVETVNRIVNTINAMFVPQLGFSY